MSIGTRELHALLDECGNQIMYKAYQPCDPSTPPKSACGRTIRKLHAKIGIPNTSSSSYWPNKPQYNIKAKIPQHTPCRIPIFPIWQPANNVHKRLVPGRAQYRYVARLHLLSVASRSDLDTMHLYQMMLDEGYDHTEDEIFALWCYARNAFKEPMLAMHNLEAWAHEVHIVDPGGHAELYKARGARPIPRRRTRFRSRVREVLSHAERRVGMLTRNWGTKGVVELVGSLSTAALLTARGIRSLTSSRW